MDERCSNISWLLVKTVGAHSNFVPGSGQKNSALNLAKKKLGSGFPKKLDYTVGSGFATLQHASNKRR